MSTLPQDRPSYNWRQECQQFVINQCLPTPIFMNTGQALAPDSYKRLHERQCAYALMFLQMSPDYLLTLRFNYPLRSPEIYDGLKRFDKLLNDLCFGHKAYRLPEGQRVEWYGTAEDSQHVHLLIRQPTHGRSLVRYTDDAYGRDMGLSAYLTEMMRRTEIAKDVDAERIDPCRMHIACVYLLKRAWSKRVVDSHERDFVFHSSFFHTHNQRFQDHRDSVPSLRLAASHDPLAVTVQV